MKRVIRMDQDKVSTAKAKVEVKKVTTESIRDVNIQPEEEKALVRRVDIVLMPTLWLMYLFSYADRTK